MKTKVLIYSSTHWDREWYLSQTQFQYRLIRTIDEIMELLSAGDGMNVFVLDGQTCIVKDYLELRPEREAELRRMIADGKLVIGPWYSMPDDLLAGGEALIRNLLRGRVDCAAFGAVWPRVGYVPDSFGHIEQMPQILRGVGIDNFVFGRGRPVAMDLAAGHKLEFLWRAPDGSTVVALHLPEAYCNARFLPGPDRPDELKERIGRIIHTHTSSHCPGLAVAAHGVDHTWLQRDMAAILKALPALMPDVEFRQGSLDEVVCAWKTALPEKMETWAGQLRGRLQATELHGTLSSRIDNKIWNERARMYVENLAEPLDAIARHFGKADAACHLRKAWELIFQNHAHDSICGCSQDRVHDEVNTRFLKAAEIGTDIADSALDYLNWEARRDQSPAVLVYAGLNGGHNTVDFVLRLPAGTRLPASLESADGGLYPVQFSRCEKLRITHSNAVVECREARGCVYMPDLAATEVRRLVPSDRRASLPDGPVVCRGLTLENARLRVEVRQDGTIDLTDPSSGRSVSGAHYFVHETDLGGGYHFEPLPGGIRRETRGGRARVRCLARGPLRAALEVKTRLMVPAAYDRQKQKCRGRAMITFTSTLTLEAGSDTLKVRTVIDNTAGNQRLRLVVPGNDTMPDFHADASFAVHAIADGTWPAEPGQASHPMRSFIDMSGSGGGCAFLGRGLHEYAIEPRVDGGCDIEVTLLRSVDFVLMCCTWETPGAQLRGPITHDYALRLHDGDWREGGVAESAAAFLNYPVASVSGDSCHPRETQDHCTIAFHAVRSGVAVPVDSNRSSWHVTNAHRDGWRRIEPDRFPSTSVSGQIVPFIIEGEHVIVSAFKRAIDGRGEILRFWSAASSEQSVKVHVPDRRILRRSNLLEENNERAESGAGMLTLVVRPFEIVTLRIDDPPAGVKQPQSS